MQERGCRLGSNLIILCIIQTTHIICFICWCRWVSHLPKLNMQELNPKSTPLFTRAHLLSHWVKSKQVQRSWQRGQSHGKDTQHFGEDMLTTLTVKQREAGPNCTNIIINRIQFNLQDSRQFVFSITQDINGGAERASFSTREVNGIEMRRRRRAGHMGQSGVLVQLVPGGAAGVWHKWLWYLYLH